MQDQASDNKRLSRRTFLRGGGLLLGAAAVAPLLGPAEVMAASTKGMTAAASTKGMRAGPQIGLLLPHSTLYPTLGSEFRLGLQQGFVAAGVQPKQVAVATIGGQGGTYGRAKSLLEGGAEVLVGWLTPAMADRLGDLCQQHGASLLAVSLGENLATKQPHPTVLLHSLQEWQASWALGTWAAQNVGRRVLIAAANYEAAYDSVAAFQEGVIAGGGTIAERVITHGSQEQPDLDQLLQRITASRPDAVYAAYSGQPATNFLRAYDSMGKGRPTLLCNPTLAEIAPAGSYSATAWPTSDSAASQQFVAACQQAGLRPSRIALLGYEAASLLSAAASSGVPLGQARCEGPRGSLALDHASQSSSASFYLRQAHASDRETLRGPSLEAASGLRMAIQSGLLEAYLSI